MHGTEYYNDMHTDRHRTEYYYDINKEQYIT